jgi:hypothetical protein
VSDTSEQTAEKIAAQGREALISRLRPAFEEAAAAHADVLKLGPDQIESMIQRAADRADGLQWRRALAAVATSELGISLGEALGHPAVVRAHELVDAPSYEASLAELGPVAPRPATPAAPAAAADEPEADAAAAPPQDEASDDTAAADEPETTEAAEDPEDSAEEDDGEPEAEEEPADGEEFEQDAEAVEAEHATSEEPDDEAEAEEESDDEEPEGADPDATAVHDAFAEPDPPIAGGLDGSELPAMAADLAAPPHLGEESPGTAEYEVEGWEDEFYEEDEGIRVSVIHLGGIANLSPAEGDIELLMSADGLDIVRGSTDVLGRLDWAQVKALEVPLPRSRRRRKPGPTHLVIRTAKGDASFEVPELSPEELRQHLAPVVTDYVHQA